MKEYITRFVNYAGTRGTFYIDYYLEEGELVEEATSKKRVAFVPVNVPGYQERTDTSNAVQEYADLFCNGDFAEAVSQLCRKGLGSEPS